MPIVPEEVVIRVLVEAGIELAERVDDLEKGLTALRNQPMQTANPTPRPSDTALAQAKSVVRVHLLSFSNCKFDDRASRDLAADTMASEIVTAVLTAYGIPH